MHRSVSEPRSVALGFSQQRGCAGFVGDTPGNRGRYDAPVHAGQQRLSDTEGFQPPGDIGAVGRADAASDKQIWKPRANVHVAAGRRERGHDDARQLVDARERGQNADRTQVVVLHEQMTTRGDRIPQTPQYGDALGQVVEQEAGVDEIERTSWHVIAAHIRMQELALAMPGVAEHRHCLAPDRGVDVDADHPPRWPDSLCHQAHRLSRTTTSVEAAATGRERDPIEQPCARRFPRLGLGAQPVIFPCRALERVAAARILEGAHHGRSLLAIVTLPIAGNRPAARIGSRREPHLIFSRRGGKVLTEEGGRLTAGHIDLRERVTELEQIERLLGDLLAREGRALLIQGQAGIGKTALLDVARRRADDRGIAVLTARGGELEGHFPFGVARQLFEPVLLHASPDARSDLLGGAARLAAPIVESAVEREPARTEDAFGVLHGLHWLTVNLSTRSPVLILVDDLHWADAGSLRFLLYLAARLDGVACAVIGAMRPVEPTAPAPSLETRMLIDRLFEVVTPAALSNRAVHDVLAAGLGRDPDETFIAAASDATGGVPFLLRELVSTLADEGIEPNAEEASRVPHLGPHTIAQATLVRLARMPEGCVPLTHAVAVLGGDARLPRVARLAGLQEAEALDALDALVSAGLVRVHGRIEFVHPILRAAIYDVLAPGERSRLHHRAADLLASEGAELDAVAAQLLPSEPTGSPHVIEQLRQAAAFALGRAAPEDGVAYLTRALDEGGTRDVRAAILFDLGRAARLNTDPTMLEHFAEARRLAEDPSLRGNAAFELATALGLKGEWDEAMSLLDEALDELGDHDRELANRLECYRAAIMVSFPRLVAGFDRRLPMLGERVDHGGPASRSLALLLASNAVWREGDEDWSAALVERGWDDGRFLDAGADLWSLGQGLQALVISGHLEQAREVTDALFADGRLRGSMARFVLASAYRGWIDAREGRLTAAEGKLRAAIERVRAPHARYSLCTYLWLAADVMVERPRCADLVDLAEGLDLAQMSGGLIEALLCEVRGRVRHVIGNTTAAIEDLRRAGEIFGAVGIRNPNGSCWRSALALMLDLDARDEALGLAAEELEDARRIGQPRGIGVALRALGVLRGDRDLLRQALAVLERSPARLEHARALIELGATMRRAGERAACRSPLRAGLDIAVEGGATRLGERARAELESSGARLRRERISGRDALTPSELRVARLAAEGRTNNEVAQALFVTPKTIDTHLSHVYSKLGISSRRALSAALEGATTSVAG